MVVKLLTLGSISIVTTIYSVSGDCGEPGRSQVSIPIQSDRLPNKTYPEGHWVEYKCHKGLLILLYHKRRCVNGEWDSPIPSCGELDMV